MIYCTQSVPNHGGRFILTEGSIQELYQHVASALYKHYHNNGLVIKLPATPNFSYTNFGEKRLNPCVVEDVNSRRIGSINMIYFKGGIPGKARRDVDYRASRAFAFTDDQVTYDSLTLYFDISRNGIPKDAKDWSRDTERDVFLEKIVSGELN